jgi:cytochrome c-type biogenesis protein CcmE
MNIYVKFGILIVAIIGTLTWLAIGGVNDTKTYYKTISELNQLDAQGKARKLRVGGEVATDSIVRNGSEVRFVITQTDGPKRPQLNVVYNGMEPLPDTFKGGALALADGKLGPDGVFHATKIQAKCASKYETKPSYPGGPQAKPAASGSPSI